jgi:hypothetical protein
MRNHGKVGADQLLHQVQAEITVVVFLATVKVGHMTEIQAIEGIVVEDEVLLHDKNVVAE